MFWEVKDKLSYPLKTFIHRIPRIVLCSIGNDWWDNIGVNTYILFVFSFEYHTVGVCLREWEEEVVLKDGKLLTSVQARMGGLQY